ncbi:MAG TPA: hypothetical protein VJ739_01925 [Gemmataceae bacterium]|nr:hypothetical protein [Gemmataceae bacterium]
MASPSRRLEFSRSAPGAEQRLLFDETAPVVPADPAAAPTPERFYADGFALLSGLGSAAEARVALDRFLAHLDPLRLPLFARFAGRVQLAKVDRIPVCHDIVPRSFQALHFDMGQPIVSDSTQAMYLLLGLYRPPGEGPTSAATRVTGLRRLLGQRAWPGRAEVERRLVDYARRHGDGWFAPDTVNTCRLACFARVLDAVTGRHELIDYVDHSTGDWFQDERHRDGSVGLANEAAYYRGCGLDLAAAEERVCLREGELLVVDNLRAVHGRYGPRRPAEIYQFLYGVQSATPADVDGYRADLVDAF